MVEENNKMEMKKIRKKILTMILPITMENILQMTAGIVSMGMIGRISPIAIGALGISMRITQIIWAIFKGIATGTTVLVAQSYGGNHLKRLKNIIQQTILSSIILVIFMQQWIYWKPRFFLSIFDPSTGLMESAVVYIKIVSWGLPFMVIMLIVAGILQGMGNATTPMIIALIMNGFNIVFSFLLIFGSFGLPKLGLEGAAIATVLAQVVGAMIGLYILFNKKGILSGVLKRSFFTLDFHEIVKVYKVGIPTSMESVFWQVAAIILTKVILTFGEIPFAAHQLGLQAESISYMPAAGFAIAATAFVGQALGARDGKMAKCYLKETLKGALLITAVSASLLIFCPKIVMALLTDDKRVIELGAKYLIIMGLVQVPQNVSGVLNGALRGAGFTNVPMIVAGTGLWIVRIPLSLIVAYYYHFTIIAIWIVMGVDLIFRFCLSFYLYKRKNIYENEIVLVE